jgi:hypothetical protein
MTGDRGSEVQRAIAFLSSPELGDGRSWALPPQPDYEALARRALELGHHLSPGAVEEAFRMMMRARLVPSRKPARAEPQ